MNGWAAFLAARRVVVFTLGVVVTLDALVSDNAIPQLIIGMVMVGVLPLDDVILAARHPRLMQGVEPVPDEQPDRGRHRAP